MVYWCCQSDTSTLIGDSPECVVSFCRSLIPTEATAATHNFVLALQVYRATGNSVAAKNLFKPLTEINEHWMKLREQIVASDVDIPDPAFVQGNVLYNDNRK